MAPQSPSRLRSDGVACCGAAAGAASHPAFASGPSLWVQSPWHNHDSRRDSKIFCRGQTKNMHSKSTTSSWSPSMKMEQRCKRLEELYDAFNAKLYVYAE